MRFQLLGPLQVLRGGERVPLGPAKQRAVLAALLCEPNRVVPVDRLVAAVWEDEPPASAIANVRTYVSRLRGRLVDDRGVPRIVSRGPGYLLSLTDGESDVADFHRLARQGRSALDADEPDKAAAMLGDALALWRGSAAEDVSRSTGLARRLTLLNEQRRTTVEDWFAARQSLGAEGELVHDLRVLAEETPLRERVWCLLIVALYRAGDIAGALAGYRQARAVLAENLGVDPGPELRRLHQAVLARDPSLDGPGLRPAPRARTTAR